MSRQGNGSSARAFRCLRDFLCQRFVRVCSAADGFVDYDFVALTPARSDAPVIEVIDYHKNYRDLVAVAGLSFSVPGGAVLGLVGPNGAGKTTTMRAIAGIIPPTRGRLLVAGHDVVNDSVAAKQQLAYVPDDPKLFDMLTVWEHLEFSAATYRVAEFKPRAEELLQQFELIEKRDTLAQELSRGMRQKVAVACAYLHDPRAILFDEPLTGLDPRGIRTLKQSIVDRAKAGDQLPPLVSGRRPVQLFADPAEGTLGFSWTDLGCQGCICSQRRE
jgi:ABC-2 type transport system ATP-binding protein